MVINILTLFPKMFESVFNESIIKRAKEKGLVKINIYNLRDWANDKHKTVDDSPYGGGAGMVMKVDVIDRAIASLKLKTKKKLKTILLTPQGKIFTQKKAETLSSYSELLLICGHYEGFDERVRKLVDEEISVGDYVLTGGEIPAMVITDAVTRLIPSVLGKDESSREESFSMKNFFKQAKRSNDNCERSDPTITANEAILEYPQYTRPVTYKPTSKNYKHLLKVPKILLSGDHRKIRDWRLQECIKRTESKKIQSQD